MKDIQLRCGNLGVLRAVGWVLWWGGGDGGGCLGVLDEFLIFGRAMVWGEGVVGGLGGWVVGLEGWKLDLDIEVVGVGVVARSFLGTLGWKWKERGFVMVMGPNLSWRHGWC